MIRTLLVATIAVAGLSLAACQPKEEAADDAANVEATVVTETPAMTGDAMNAAEAMNTEAAPAS